MGPVVIGTSSALSRGVLPDGMRVLSSWQVYVYSSDGLSDQGSITLAGKISS